MADERFFTERFDRLDGDGREAYHQAVFMNMPGEAAAAARVEYYRRRMRRMGSNVTIGMGVRIVNPQWIDLGDNVLIRDGCTLIATSERGIRMANSSRLQNNVYLDGESPDGGYIAIGERVYVGTGTCLHGHKGLEIGDDTLMAQNITITPYSHKFDDPTKTIYSQGGFSRKVTIGRDCYLGMNVSVVYSADIGEGSVVGAGSVVVKTIPPFSVAVGVPAKVIRKRDGGSS